MPARSDVDTIACPGNAGLLPLNPDRRVQRGHGINHRRGHTLLEMLTVLAIIGFIASLAIPASTTSHHDRLELAAAELADALRFAREEARRTTVLHGVTLDAANDEFRVFRVDEAPDPNQRIYDLYHPVSKQPYTRTFTAAPFGDITLSAVNAQAVGSCNDLASLAFDGSGMLRCFEPTTTYLPSASAALSGAGRQLTVQVDGFTGRVTVQ